MLTAYRFGVVSSSHSSALFALFFTLEYILTIPPHSTYVIDDLDYTESFTHMRTWGKCFAQTLHKNDHWRLLLDFQNNNCVIL